jgi:ferredoxin
MCDICGRHGEGTRWYLNPKNYASELEESRMEYLERLSGRFLGEWMADGYELAGRFQRIPLLGKLLTYLGDQDIRRTMGGQIIPLRDVIEVLDLCQNPALLPCECRILVGEERHNCLNFGIVPQLYEKANPKESIEEVSVRKAKRILTDFDERGLYHLILWNRLPYVTTVCNCTAPICAAYKGRRILGLKSNMLKGEYVAFVDPEKCRGCKTCLTRCPFGAIRFNLDAEKAFVEIRACYGCGLCESACPSRAVTLQDRLQTPARNLW